MAYKITDDCISCGACAGTSEGENHYEIDADMCVECGACQAGCPAGAIEA